MRGGWVGGIENAFSFQDYVIIAGARKWQCDGSSSCMTRRTWNTGERELIYGNQAWKVPLVYLPTIYPLTL